MAVCLSGRQIKSSGRLPGQVDACATFRRTVRVCGRRERGDLQLAAATCCARRIERDESPSLADTESRREEANCSPTDQSGGGLFFKRRAEQSVALKPQETHVSLSLSSRNRNTIALFGRTHFFEPIQLAYFARLKISSFAKQLRQLNLGKFSRQTQVALFSSLNKSTG